MSSFTCANQFDTKYKSIGNFGDDRNACPLFAIFSAYHFMKNKDIGKQQHEDNIDAAVANLLVHSELPKYMALDEITQFMSGYNESDIGGTTPELLNLMGYDMIYDGKDKTKDHVIIFLKNSNFITVLYNSDTGIYSVRDCHEKEQHDIMTYEDLQIYLNKTYQFNELTVVDGVMIDEYANIEYLVIDKPFQLVNLDPNLYDGGNDVDVKIMYDDEEFAKKLQEALNNGNDEQYAQLLQEMI